MAASRRFQESKRLQAGQVLGQRRFHNEEGLKRPGVDTERILQQDPSPYNQMVLMLPNAIHVRLAKPFPGFLLLEELL